MTEKQAKLIDNLRAAAEKAKERKEAQAAAREKLQEMILKMRERAQK